MHNTPFHKMVHYSMGCIGFFYVVYLMFSLNSVGTAAAEHNTCWLGISDETVYAGQAECIN